MKLIVLHNCCMLTKKAGEGGFANLLGFAIQFVLVTSCALAFATH